MSKWLVPLAAVVAIVALFAGVRFVEQIRGEDSAGGAPASPGPGDEPTGGGVPGDPGSSEEPPGIPPGQPSPVPVPKQTNRYGVPIESYYLLDPRTLLLRYTIGVPECYGTIAEPKVGETPGSVTVTLTRVPPPPLDEHVACIEIALLKTVKIRIDAPLAGRAVLDGSFGGSPVEPAATPFPGAL